LIRAASVIGLVIEIVVLVVVGVLVGWRLSVALVAFWALWALRLHTAPPEPGRLRTTVEFILFALIGMALGALAFGGVGAIFGFTMGAVARLAEIPTTGVLRSRKQGDSNGPHPG
jgi:hypothetical protein